MNDIEKFIIVLLIGIVIAIAIVAFGKDRFGE